jgi:hypothetical protein
MREEGVFAGNSAESLFATVENKTSQTTKALNCSCFKLQQQ